MGEQPNFYRSLKWLSQEFERRKRFIETSGLTPEQARVKVLSLAAGLTDELEDLESKISRGVFENERSPEE